MKEKCKYPLNPAHPPLHQKKQKNRKARPDRREAHSQTAEWSLCGGMYSENGALSQRSTRLSLQHIRESTAMCPVQVSLSKTVAR